MSDLSPAPLFSICIPFYDGMDTIHRTLYSLLIQPGERDGFTLTRDDIEIIITNDDQRPEVKAALDALGVQYGLKIIHNDCQMGLTGNWQKALSVGRGHLRALLHQDDWYAPYALLAMMESFAADPDLVAVFMCPILFPDHLELVKSMPVVRPGVHRGADFAHMMLDVQGVPAPSIACFNGDKLDELDVLYNADRYMWCSEFDLYLRQCAQFPDGGFLYDVRPLVCRGLSSAQFSANNEDMRILDYCRILTDHSHFLGKGAKRSAILRKWGDKSASLIARFMKNMRIPNISGIQDVERWLERIFGHADFRALLDDENAFVEGLIDGFGKYLAKTGMLPTVELLLCKPFLEVINDDTSARALDAIHMSSLDLSDEAMNKTKKLAAKILGTTEFYEPVIICGFHHSGTRLLAELLDRIGVFQYTNSPTHEWSYIQYANTLILPGWEQAAEVDAFDPEDPSNKSINVEELAFKLAHRGYAGYAAWGQKDPRNSATVGAWLKAFPKAKIINIVRHPLDVLGTLPDQYAQYTPEGVLPQANIEFWTDAWLSYYRATHAVMSKAEKSIEVTFEDLCKEPLDTLARVSDGLELPCKPRKSDLKGLTINKAKRDVYKEWLADGRLSPAAVAHIEAAIAGLDLPYNS